MISASRVHPLDQTFDGVVQSHGPSYRSCPPAKAFRLLKDEEDRNIKDVLSAYAAAEGLA
jgi:hypothetical protein